MILIFRYITLCRIRLYEIILRFDKLIKFQRNHSISSQEIIIFENNDQTLTITLIIITIIVMIVMIKMMVTYNDNNYNNNNNNNRIKWFHSILSLTWSSSAMFKQGSMIKTWLAWVRLIPTAPALIDRRNTVVGGSFYSGLKNVQREGGWIRESVRVRDGESEAERKREWEREREREREGERKRERNKKIRFFEAKLKRFYDLKYKMFNRRLLKIKLYLERRRRISIRRISIKYLINSKWNHFLFHSFLENVKLVKLCKFC